MVAIVSSRAFLQVNLVRYLCPFLNQEALHTISHVLVTCWLHVTWSCPWRPSRSYSCFKMQLYGQLSLWLSVTTATQAILAPAGFWMQFKVLIIAYKTLHGIGPGYLRDHLSTIAFVYPIHSSRMGAVQVPTI